MPQAATARARSSLLKGHRSSTEPPPRATIITSGRGTAGSNSKPFKALITWGAAVSPCTTTGQTTTRHGQRSRMRCSSCVAYDRLLLSVGATSRRLTCPGAELAGVHYLRALADVGPIREAARPGAHAVIIGGGYIGLETAATLTKLGCTVTVLEMADRIMNRVVAPTTSAFFAADHLGHHVKLLCEQRVVRLEGSTRVDAVKPRGSSPKTSGPALETSRGPPSAKLGSCTGATFWRASERGAGQEKDESACATVAMAQKTRAQARLKVGNW